MSDPKYLRPGFDFCLSHLVEECGEVLAAAGKTQRWGALSVDPTLPEEQQETNADWLLRELADLKEAISRMEFEINHAVRLRTMMRHVDEAPGNGR